MGIDNNNREITQYEQNELQKILCVIKDKFIVLKIKLVIFKRKKELYKMKMMQYFIKEKQQILRDQFLQISPENFQFADDYFIKLYHILKTYLSRKQKARIDIPIYIKKNKQQIQQLKVFLQTIQNKTAALKYEYIVQIFCIYHSDQLNYFSCRTWEADEYFTCFYQCGD
ncbi:unnamed protein product [Paramecium sonneborni]|uniref:Uncharacterized protein n=1 Tax=Paramecium sonneborni TaxID=65129 RepID=A0A8S1M4G4_9CILI|nr:unnamed protein product [Paramecium sonneborni]CAD8072763.1 unnamed protein product [Paramecium sonneborni]